MRLTTLIMYLDGYILTSENTIVLLKYRLDDADLGGKLLNMPGRRWPGFI